MRSFDSKYGYDGEGAREKLTATVQDIKASPYAGKTRLVVKKDSSDRSHQVIDVDQKYAKDIKTRSSRDYREEEAMKDPKYAKAKQEDRSGRKDKPYNSNQGKYIFDVMERDDSKNPGFQRKKSAEFRSYDCVGKPENYVAGSETTERMNRFEGGATGQTPRTRF